MKVDADKNPVNGQAFPGVRCIMNYPYGEELWSDYAVRMIDHAADRNVDIDDLVAGVLPTVSGSRWRMPTQARPKGLSCGSIPCGGTPIR